MPMKLMKSLFAPDGMESGYAMLWFSLFLLLSCLPKAMEVPPPE